MPSVILGNTAPIEVFKVDEGTDEVERVPRTDLGDTWTEFNIPDSVPFDEAFKTVREVFASHHSDADASWVESSDPVLADLLARHYDCPVGRPTEEETEEEDA